MITQEGSAYAAEWSRHGREYLDSYLIQEVEHPAVNPQSVLMRAFLMDRLFPGQFSPLVEEELYFSACACFALLGQREGWFPQLFARVEETDGGVDGELPEFLQREFHQRTSSRFEIKALFEELAKCLTLGFEFFQSPFHRAWNEAIAAVPSAETMKRLRSLELACGSANDYRFFDHYGQAAFLDYTGVDVCPENIDNARARYPEVDFQVDDVTKLDADDDDYDVVMAFDLYEHLSPTGLDAAIDESVRVCRDELWLSFFNLSESPVHEFSQEGNYYWNALSITELTESLQTSGCDRIEIISLQRELEDRFPGYRHYNPEAHIVIAGVEGSSE